MHKMAGIPTIQKTLVTDGWLVGGLSVVFGWRVGMVWALWAAFTPPRIFETQSEL